MVTQAATLENLCLELRDMDPAASWEPKNL